MGGLARVDRCLVTCEGTFYPEFDMRRASRGEYAARARVHEDEGNLSREQLVQLKKQTL